MSTSLISLQEFAEWMKFSISAHNSQPFQISEDQLIFKIWYESDRLLPVADPQHKDLFTSLGALFETLNAFASLKKKSLEIVSHQTQLVGDRPLLEFKVNEGKDSEFINISLYENRFSYRGIFRKKLQKEKQKISTDHAFIVEEKNKIDQIAQLFDEVNFEAMVSKGYIEELYKWLRFDSVNPRWSQDGLNSEAMALSGIENWGASKVLQPKLFRFLSSIGLGRLLIQESEKIKSALGLWVIWAPSAADAFECGRIFQREWVNLTAHRIFGAPLSVLTDREDKSIQLKEILGLREDQKLVNVLRVGFLEPQYSRYKPARKSTAENIRNP
jgi:hypothetical protein